MDLKIEQVAELLNVSESTIRKWLANGEIPAYKLNHQTCFSRSEIEDWVMKHQLKDELGVSPFSNCPTTKSLSIKGGQNQYSLFRALHKGGIFYDLPAASKEELLTKVTQKISKELDVDAEVLSELLLDREKLQPTALGNGLAVPHTRDVLLKGRQDVVALVFPKKPLDWGALDGKPVSTLFFLFASSDARHLHLLAKIAYLSSQPEALKLLAQKPPQEELLEFVKAWESNVRQR